MLSCVQLFGHNRLLCPRDSPGKNSGVGCRFLLQGVFLTQGSNLHFFPSPALAGRFFTASATWDFVVGAQSVWKDIMCNKVKASTGKGEIPS